jgi:hypothetical protein
MNLKLVTRFCSPILDQKGLMLLDEKGLKVDPCSSTGRTALLYLRNGILEIKLPLTTVLKYIYNSLVPSLS